jgi:hypothetical protein
MKPADQTPQTVGQPPLAELMARYLKNQVTAHGDGLAVVPTVGEVVPFEAAPVQPVDARLAWEDSLRVLKFFSPVTKTASFQPPPHWGQLVTAHEPAVALAFCFGNFPQLVRNFQPLLHGDNLGKLRPQGGRAVAVPALFDWAAEVASKNQFPQTLIAVGALRLAKQFDRAAEILQQHQAAVPAEWREAWANETAALVWHRGQGQEALAQWQSQDPSVPVLFNRGMAAYFLNQPAVAATALREAVGQLPEAGAWHHLGRVYLTLAEVRS